MKVLFVSYGGGHIQMCLPVIRALRRRVPSCDISLMALTTAAKIARKAGEQTLGFVDFLTDQDAEVARNWGERLLLGNQHPDVDRAETVAYLGLNFIDWIHQYGLQEALQRWQSLGRHGFMPVRFFERVLSRLQPDVVVTTNSPRSEQAVVAAASALKIPSLSMVDLFGLQGDPFFNRPVHADRNTVMSESVKRNLIRAGLPGDRIIVTGNPAFDVLAQPQAFADGLAWRVKKGWQNHHIILWAGHREPQDSDNAWAGTALGNKVLRRLIQWVERHHEVALVVRYHPNEWPDFERPPAHPCVHWSQPDEEELTGVLMAADCVVVQATTVGVQAYFAGKKVVSLGFSPLVQRTGMDYFSLGMGLRVDSLDSLEVVLDKYQTDHRQREPFASPCAAEAVCAEIVNLVRYSRCGARQI